MITATRPEVEPETLSGVELLEEMLAIPSPSTQERALGQWLVSRMRGMGFAARRDEVGPVGLMGKVKARFDPAGICAPGPFVGGI